jgi:GT2 family glycosyltransferase
MPLDFSAVIPSYRRPAELGEAITSILRQSGVTVEVLVVDDCPNRSASEAVNAINDPRVSYLPNPNPTGGKPSIVRNLGWPRAKGCYVHFLDDDDIVPEGHYAALKAVFEEHPKIGLVFGRIEPFGDCPEWQLQHERRYFAAAASNALSSCRFGSWLAFASRMLFGPAMLVCSAGVVRRECLEHAGGFDPRIVLLEDAEFYLRIMRACGALFVDRTALHYRIGFPSLMHSPNPSLEQLRLQREGRKLMREKYVKERGIVEFLALALFARTVLKLV